MSELQLVRAAAVGDESAAAALYRRHASLVRGMVAQRIQDRALVEDLCQEAWIRVFRALPGFRGNAAFSTWLHSIVRNLLNSWSRRKTLVQFHTDLVNETARSVSDPADLRLDLQRALATIPDGMRQILMLHDVEGWTHDEIADALGIATGTSKSQLFKARAKLRSALEEPEPAAQVA